MTALRYFLLTLVCSSLFFGLSEQLNYATTNGPKVACYETQDEVREVIVQKPNKGCLTPDYAVICNLDWDNKVFHHVIHKEVCCKGYDEQNGLCIRKLSWVSNVFEGINLKLFSNM